MVFLIQAGSQNEKWLLVETGNTARNIPNSIVRGYLLTHQTQGSSPNTIEYYQGILGRFIWYAEKSGWSDDVRLISEWNIREFLGYVGTKQ